MSSSSPLIAFNAHLLSGDTSYRSAGIAVYIASLLQHLGSASQDLRFQILLGDGVLPDGISLPVTRSRVSTRSPWRRILWEQSALPLVVQQLGASLLHGPAFAGPLLSSCPQVITVPDLSFLRHPEFFRTGNRLYLSMITGLACRRSAAVIAISDFTAREVVALLGVPSERVITIYPGVAPRFRPIPEAAVARFRAEKGLPERYILYLGTLEPRKNLIRLVRAYSRLRDPGLHLVLAGAQGWFYEGIFAEVERLGLKERVHFPGFVPAEEQAFWYNAARVFAYVSVYEGFGMPVVEALACGVPTVTASTTSLPEAGGESVIAVPPDDEAAIADALDRVVSDNSLRCEMRDRGIAHAASFTWEATAVRTMTLYRQVVDRRLS